MVIVADKKIAYVKEAFAPFGEVRLLAPSEITREKLLGADALLVRSVTNVNQELLQGTNVRFIGTATIGADHVDANYLRQQNISFARAAGCNSTAVSEYILTVLLWLANRFSFRLKGKTLGIVGVGNIGTKVARVAQALKMKVLLNDPPLARTTGDSRYLPLDKLMRSDILTLHVPLNRNGQDATYHLFDEKRFNRMKSGAILINSCRGSVVSGKDLASAIRRKKLRAGVLDVWENEPNIDLELLNLTSLATPHIAGYSLEGKVRGTQLIYEAFCRAFELTSRWSEVPGLPAPLNRTLRVDPESASREHLLWDIVRTCYDIEHDDSALRKIRTSDAGQRSTCFEGLRSGYPLRREFFNTKIQFTRPDSGLQDILQDLGFSVIQQGAEVQFA